MASTVGNLIDGVGMFLDDALTAASEVTGLTPEEILDAADVGKAIANGVEESNSTGRSLEDALADEFLAIGLEAAAEKGVKWVGGASLAAKVNPVSTFFSVLLSPSSTQVELPSRAGFEGNSMSTREGSIDLFAFYELGMDGTGVWPSMNQPFSMGPKDAFTGRSSLEDMINAPYQDKVRAARVAYQHNVLQTNNRINEGRARAKAVVGYSRVLHEEAVRNLEAQRELELKGHKEVFDLRVATARMQTHLPFDQKVYAQQELEAKTGTNRGFAVYTTGGLYAAAHAYAAAQSVASRVAAGASVGLGHHSNLLDVGANVSALVGINQYTAPFGDGTEHDALDGDNQYVVSPPPPVATAVGPAWSDVKSWSDYGRYGEFHVSGVVYSAPKSQSIEETIQARGADDLVFEIDGAISGHDGALANVTGNDFASHESDVADQGLIAEVLSAVGGDSADFSNTAREAAIAEGGEGLTAEIVSAAGGLGRNVPVGPVAYEDLTREQLISDGDASLPAPGRDESLESLPTMISVAEVTELGTAIGASDDQVAAVVSNVTDQEVTAQVAHYSAIASNPAESSASRAAATATLDVMSRNVPASKPYANQNYESVYEWELTQAETREGWVDDAVQAVEESGGYVAPAGTSDEDFAQIQAAGQALGINVQTHGDVDAGVSDPTIICAELFRQGCISSELYEFDEAFGRTLRRFDPDALSGYHAWAQRVVVAMRRSSKVTQAVNLIAHPIVVAMAHRAGRPEKNAIGGVLLSLGIFVCRGIGRSLRHLKRGFGHRRALEELKPKVNPR